MERRMHRCLSQGRLAAGIAIAAIGWTASATAQSFNKNEWRYAVAPYMWASGLEGDIGVGPVSSSVDLTAGDILRELKFGIMGRGEARKGSYVLALDGIYAKLGTSRAFAIRGDTGGLELTQRETILNPMGGYTLGDGTWSVDLLLGMRYWNLSTSLDVDRTRRPSNERSMTQQWVDATGGFRFHWAPIEKLRFVAAGDGGGGGSRDTWQAYSSLGYDAWSRWTFGMGYRVLAVNYDRNDFLFDTRSKGFEVVATYRTW
jgi:hypothetical protein